MTLEKVKRSHKTGMHGRDPGMNNLYVNLMRSEITNSSPQEGSGSGGALGDTI